MADFKKAPESQNFQDTTGFSPTEKFLHGLMVKLNPVYAVRNVAKTLREKGVIDTEGAADMAGRANAKAYIEQNKRRSEAPPPVTSIQGLSPEEITVILERIKRDQISNRK